MRWRRNANAPARIVGDLTDETGTDDEGAVRSVQGGTLILRKEDLDRIWNADAPRAPGADLLALPDQRATLGIVRVKYTETERTVVILFRPFRLLRFQAPEYEMDDRRGIVRWRIEDGVLVARRGRGGDGYLEIDVRREAPLDDDADGCERLRVEVEVANFYPAIASRLARWVYANTQSRIHVIVTWGFLRSLARLDLGQVARRALRRRWTRCPTRRRPAASAPRGRPRARRRFSRSARR